MQRQFKLMILVNGLLVFLYVFSNWAEYSIMAIGSFHDDVTIQPYFPFYFTVTRFNVGFSAILFLNYPLTIFLTAMLVNLYFIFRLQRSKETRPTA